MATPAGDSDRAHQAWRAHKRICYQCQTAAINGMCGLGKGIQLWMGEADGAVPVDPAVTGMHSSAIAADRVCAMIAGDMRAGVVPATVTSFEELHEHVDANEYLTVAVPDRADGTFDTALIDAVTEVVDARLRQGMVSTGTFGEW